MVLLHMNKCSTKEEVIYHMIKDIERGRAKKKRYGPIFVVVLILCVLNIVYLTNGTKESYLHLIYLPIILSAYYWGSVKTSIIAAIAGLLMSFIPLDVAEGISQNTMSWVNRMIILAMIGFATGALFEKVHKLNEILKDKELISDLTGLYNLKKMFYDLRSMLDRGEVFRIVSIKLSNIEGIGKYVNYGIVQKLIKRLIEDIKIGYKCISMYSSSDDELIIISPKDCDFVASINSLVSKYSKAVEIDGFQVRLPLKVGVYNYMGEPETAIAIYNKARIASEQGEIVESGIYYYNMDIDKTRKEVFEIAGSLHNAIVNKEFYLVYQPKIDIVNNEISGVEVLIRWDRGERKPVGPNVFIDIAEKTGFINEISKFVIENTIKQITMWKNENISLNCSINITVQELINQELIEWVVDTMDSNKIDRSMIGLEITERVISKESERIKKRLEYLRQIGFKIAVDDFGTGYNSMMMIGTIPYDILKIDKFFIDRIGNFEDRMLIRNIIDYFHVLEKKVVAEGVETEEQLNYLKEYGCEEVQGYYFSKPLLPDEFVQFYKGFYKDIPNDHNTVER